MKDGLWGLVCGTEIVPVGGDEQRESLPGKDKALVIIVLSIEASLLYLSDADPTDPSVCLEILAHQFQGKS